MRRGVVGAIVVLVLLAVGAPFAVGRLGPAARPALKVRVLTASHAELLRTGRLAVRVGAGAAGRVGVNARARVRGADGRLRLIRLGRAVVAFARPGTKRVRVRLFRGARRALRGSTPCGPTRVSATAAGRGMGHRRALRRLRRVAGGCPAGPGLQPGPAPGAGGGGQGAGGGSSAPPQGEGAGSGEAAESPPEGEWLAGDQHVHTTYSHDSYGGPGDDNTGPDEAFTAGHTVSEVFTIAATRGLDYLGVSDHNDIRSQSDPGFGSSGVLGLPAYENSLNGHAQMLGATKIYDNGDKSAAAVQSLADALRADGGVFQANHPADAEDPGTLDWSYAYEVRPDAVEGWNLPRAYQQPFPSGSDNDAHVRYWEGWLNRGERVGLTGGSDSHWRSTVAAQGPGQPTTWVFAKDRTLPAILAAIRGGRTYLTDQPPSTQPPALLLEADANGNGVYEAMVGDTVPPGSALRVRVAGGGGTFLRIIAPPGRQAFDPVAVTSDEFEHEFTLPEADSWVRVELFDPDLAQQRGASCDGLLGSGTSYCRNQLIVRAMSAALYLRPPG